MVFSLPTQRTAAYGAACLFWLSACSSTSGDMAAEQPIGPPAQSASGSGCATVASLPRGGVLALKNGHTPNANFTAEVLGLEASRSTVVPAELAERITAELTGLQSMFPARAAFEAQPCYSLSSLVITLRDQADATDYDAFNEKLSANESPLFGPDTVELEFSGRYNAVRLVAEYEKLPNVQGAEVNAIGGDSADVCLEVLESTHQYIFDDATVDCASGCLEHDYHGFTVDADGNVTDLGSYNPDEPRPGGAPPWFTSATDCQQYL